MEKLKTFQDAALENGFVALEETEDGTVLWLKKPTANAEDRMCIDSLTNSVTVFWATMPWKINSKTFRTVSAMQDWFVLNNKHAAALSNREALLRLASDKNDSLAMTSLSKNNGEIIRSTFRKYFQEGLSEEKNHSEVMQRVAAQARRYEVEQDPDEWLARCVESECDRLRNEAIQEKANID